MRKWLWAALLLVIALGVAGCGGDDEGATGDAEKAPAADAKKAKGEVAWCIGKDTSGAYGRAVGPLPGSALTG